MADNDDQTVRSIALAALPADAASIISRIGPETEILLLGEATHGTAEFYSTRTQVTLDLLRSGRFHAVCVEADFPDASRVNSYVRGSSGGDSGGGGSGGGGSGVGGSGVGGGGVGGGGAFSSSTTPQPIRDELDALSGFQSRFPKFMWRNEQVAELVRGMRELNLRRPDRAQRCWFLGMDVYALSRAADAVVSLLEKSGEREAAQRARARYACFDRFGEEAADYAKGVARGDPGCEGAAVAQLVEMLQREAARAQEAAARGAAAVSAAGEEDEEQRSAAEAAASEDALAALCNARSVVHAESYYRQMALGRRNTWNLRDSAMVETVLLVKAHLEGGVFAAVDDEEEEGEQEAPSSSSPQKTKRIIVWAHNSHLGDARATAMSRRGEHNVGQLLRQIFERKGRAAAVLNLGFSTFSGTVCAAARWGGPAMCRGVRPGMRGSYEELLHRVSRLLQGSGGEKGEGEQQQQQEQQLAAVAAAIGASSPGAFLLDLRRSRPSSSETSNAMIDALSEPRLERAIGVLYVPRSERYSHYFAAKVTAQFDLLVHVDETSAVSPLDFDGDEGGGDGTLERWRARVIGPDDPVESEE